MSTVAPIAPSVQSTPMLAELQRALKLASIHDAVCRWKRQGVCCSTCSELRERVTKMEARNG